LATLQGLISKVGIDLSDVTPGIAAANAAIGQGITQATTQAQGGLNNLRGSFDVLSASEQQAEAQAIRTAQAQARAMAAEGDRSGAVRVLAQAQNDARGISEQTNFQIQTQIAGLQNGSSVATQYGQALSSSLSSALGPIAVVTTALGVATGVVTSFVDAFKATATIESTTTAITTQLRGVRDSNQVFAEGRAFADRYKITQAELTSTLQASIGVMRNSTSSTTDLLTQLSLLQATTPDKPISEASRALRELSTGDVTSIKDLFNVSANDANRMKNEIAAGGDAVQVLARYLEESGASMELLEQRTRGAAGALNDYAVAQSQLAIAQGQFAQGPGMQILDAETRVVTATTRILTGDFDAARRSITNAADAGSFGFRLFDQILAGSLSNIARYQHAADTAAGAVTQNTDRVKDDTIAVIAATAADRDRVDTSKLTEEQLGKLQKALDDTGGRASDAYAKITQAQTDYEERGIAAAQAHTEKLADLASSNADRLMRIDATASDARAKATEDWREKVTKTTEDGHRRLLALELAYTEDIARTRADAADRSLAIDTDLAQTIADDRQSLARKLTDIAAQAAESQLASAQASADRQIALHAARAAAETDSATKLAAFEQTTLDARESAQLAYQQRLASAQATADRAAIDQARTTARQTQDAADRASDQAEDRQNAEADRAQSHMDRLAAIQAKASGTGAVGHITTLTGGRFTTEATGSMGSAGASVADQIAQENARYQAQLDATARSEALTDSRAARDAEKQRSRAAEDRAQREQDLAAAAAQVDRDYAAQEQKALAAAEKQRGVLAAAAADKLAALQAQAAQADAQAAKSDAAADARIAQQIAKAQAAQALRESDGAAAAERAHAELLARTNADLADRQAGYEAARTKAQEATALQIQDENTAYAKRLVTIAAARQEQIASQAQAVALQAAKENESYQRQETARQIAYQKQKTQLETALGEQLLAYTKAQEDIGLITHTAAADREAFLAESYGRQAQAQKAAFDQFFGGQATDAAGARRDQIGDIKDAGLLGPSGVGGVSVSIGNIALPNVSDPKSFLAELRSLVIGQVKANGGDANAYWGG